MCLCVIYAKWVIISTYFLVHSLDGNDNDVVITCNAG
jgi:hypothetical protein